MTSSDLVKFQHEATRGLCATAELLVHNYVTDCRTVNVDQLRFMLLTGLMAETDVRHE